MENRDIYLDVEGLLFIGKFSDAGPKSKAFVQQSIGKRDIPKNLNVLYVKPHSNKVTLTYSDPRPAFVKCQSSTTIKSHGQTNNIIAGESFFIRGKNRLLISKAKALNLLVLLVVALLTIAGHVYVSNYVWERKWPLLKDTPVELGDARDSIIRSAAISDLQTLLDKVEDCSSANPIQTKVKLKLFTLNNIRIDKEDELNHSVQYLIHLINGRFDPSFNIQPLLERVISHSKLNKYTKYRAQRLIDRLKKANSK